MPSPFAARDAKLSASIDRAFGEQFTFSACAVAADDVDLPTIADVSRPDFTCVGIWEGPAKSKTPYARGIADSNAHNWVASWPSVSVAEMAMVWTVRRDDRCTRLLDGAVYLVGDVFADGMGRTLHMLTSKQR